MMSNDPIKLDVAIRSTYDDIFAFAKPFEEREVMKSIVYELTRGTADYDPARPQEALPGQWVDPLLGKQRVDLRSLLLTARRIRSEQQLIADQRAEEKAKAGPPAASSSAAAGGGSTAADVSAGADAALSVGDVMDMGTALSTTTSAAALAAAREAKIAEIKHELATLRKFADVCMQWRQRTRGGGSACVSSPAA
jgi:hypothetical protein